MMSREKRINEEVIKTLKCLDNLETIEANPYFYSRLEAKLSRLPHEGHEGTGRPRIFDLFTRPLLRPAFIAILMVINLVSAAVFFLGTEREPVERQEYISAIAREYSLSPLDSYTYFPDSKR